MATAKAVPEKKSSGIGKFFRGIMSELKKVHWPGKKQIVVYTGVVLVAVLIMAIGIAVVDVCLSFLFNSLILG